MDIAGTHRGQRLLQISRLVENREIVFDHRRFSIFYKGVLSLKDREKNIWQHLILHRLCTWSVPIVLHF